MNTLSLQLSILMPVRNEGVNMGMMLKILHAVVDVPHEILVVYDDPADTTVPVVNRWKAVFPNLRLVHNQQGCGVANAIKSGVEAAHGDFVLIFAVDEVGPVIAIPEMISLMQDGCDFVSCTRYAHGGRRLGGSFVGGLLSRFANKLFQLLTRCSFTDATTGIKMFRRSIFDKVQLTARPVGWAVAFEMAIKAQLAGLVLGEVPIVSIDRLYGGTSTFSLGSWLVEYLRWFFWGVRRLHLFSGVKKVPVRVRMPSYQ
ncbi:MAG: glycosyltransferase [Elusimicrobia bacterium]|nr:glycosyltransferase [Candidatus Obscuribacterium magneticum]